MTTHREATRVDLFNLYSALARNVKERVPDGTTVPFSRTQVESALRAQQIRDEDMEPAVQHCVDTRLLEQRDPNFHLSSGSLANYHALLRRI